MISRKQPWFWLSVFFFLSYLILITWTYHDYGITYDENWRHIYGEYIIQWYESGFRDTNALTFWNLPYYGGFFFVLLQLAARISPAEVFETGHLLTALFGWLGVIGAYKLGKFLAGPLAGFLSALFLVVTPRFYGHTFNNPIDIPLATLSIFTLYYLVRVTHTLPNPPKMLILKFGLALGLALGVRVGIVIMVGYTALAFCLWFIYHQYLHRSIEMRPLTVRSTLFQLAGVFGGSCAIAYVVMLICWPAAQVQPIRQPLRALWWATHFEYPFEVYFDGEFILNTDLPWYYLLKWFWITLPEFYFIALAVGLSLTCLFIWELWRKSAPYDPKQVLGMIIVLTAVLFPPAYAAITTPVDYDEIRHFLFIVPPLAVVAAIAVAKLVERRVPSGVLAVVMVAMLASISITIVDMTQLHPNQYVFFNRVFGHGVAEAAKSFETDYWGNSYKEGVEWVVNNYNNHDNDTRTKVASCLYSLSTSYFLPTDRFEYVGSFHDGQKIPAGITPDLFLASTRWNCDKALPGKVIHTVTRQGAALLYIIEVSHDAPKKIGRADQQ